MQKQNIESAVTSAEINEFAWSESNEIFVTRDAEINVIVQKYRNNVWLIIILNKVECAEIEINECMG